MKLKQKASLTKLFTTNESPQMKNLNKMAGQLKL